MRQESPHFLRHSMQLWQREHRRAFGGWKARCPNHQWSCWILRARQLLEVVKAKQSSLEGVLHRLLLLLLPKCPAYVHSFRNQKVCPEFGGQKQCPLPLLCRILLKYLLLPALLAGRWCYPLLLLLSA